jgi:GMP reductase
MHSIVPAQHVAVSSGSSKDDMAKLKAILDALPTVRFICLDVANGYSEAFVSFVRSVREEFPEHVIIVCYVRCGVLICERADDSREFLTCELTC